MASVRVAAPMAPERGERVMPPVETRRNSFASEYPRSVDEPARPQRRQLALARALAACAALAQLAAAAALLGERLAESPASGNDHRAPVASGGPYRFTVKLLALLLPAAVVTVTLSLPNLAFAGTLHLIFVSLQGLYVAHFVAPNFT